MKAGLLFLFVSARLFATQNPVVIYCILPQNASVTPDTRSSGDPLVKHSQDSSIPSPLYFSWSIRGNPAPVVFDLVLSEDSLFGSFDFSAKNIADTFLLVWNLKIDTRYYWKVSAQDSQNNQWESRTGYFTTYPAWPRMIQIDGTTNVRDIGGRKTPEGFLIRQGIFYRSAEIGRYFPLTEKGHGQLEELHLAGDMDLRRMDEDPQPALPPPVRYIHPLKSDSSNGVYQYQDGLISTADVYAKVFKELADPGNYPLVLHCYAGVDRTGTVVAVLEALLGCSEQQMGDDFQWSCLSQFTPKDTTGDEWKSTMAYLKTFDEKDATVQAGAWNYLLKQGVTIDDMVSIRKIFTNNDKLPLFATAKQPSGAGRRRDLPGIITHVPGTSVSSFPVPAGMHRLTVYNCQGKKIREINDLDLRGNANVRLPVLCSGIYFAQWGK